MMMRYIARRILEFKLPLDLPLTAQQGLASRFIDLEAALKRKETQLQDLQHERLMALDRFQPRSDADLSNDLTKLRTQIKEFSRRLLRSSELDKMLGGGGKLKQLTLTRNIPETTWNEGPNRKFILESVLWRLLLKHLFANPFQAFGESHKIIMTTWSTIFGKGTRACIRHRRVFINQH